VVELTTESAHRVDASFAMRVSFLSEKVRRILPAAMSCRGKPPSIDLRSKSCFTDSSSGVAPCSTDSRLIFRFTTVLPSLMSPR